MKTIFKNENKHLVACLTPDTDTERTIIQHLYESGYVAKINGDFVVTITETNIDLEEEMYKKIIAIVTDYGVKFDAVIESAAAVIDQTHNYSQILSDDGTTNLTQDLDSITQQLEKRVNKVSGKTLSSNDFTDEYKNAVDEAVSTEQFTETTRAYVALLNDITDKVNTKVGTADGILHIVVSAPTSVTLDGKVVQLPTKGEHIIACLKTSKLSSIGANTIGIHRFDGIITTPIKSRSDVTFISNTTVEVTNMVWFYACANLERMTNTIVVVKTADLYGLFHTTHLSESPVILPLVDITSVSDLFFECRNLTSIPHFDTSKCTSLKNLCYRASALAAVPLYDTSSATNIHGMFTECSIKIIPKFNFSNVTNITNAFGLMSNIVEFPNHFNFSKVATATYAFNGDWGYYNEQVDTFQVGSIRRFPIYSFPVCTDLQGAWQDQSRMFSIGKLNIPACTNLDTAFHGCFNLTNVGGFTGLKCNLNMAHCKKLSVASMVNIFREAANVTALGTRTMTLGAVNLAKLTDAQKTVATDKGWTLA